MRESSSESDSRGGSPDGKRITKDNDIGGEKATRKAGSKEKGRKRTKTGCLSELRYCLFINCLRL